MLKKLLIAGGVGLAAYVINQMRKEYDKNVEDYNNLLDKCNEMSDFIQECDFYKYQDEKDSDENSRYHTETSVNQDGSEQVVIRDAATGFSLIKTKDA